MVGLDLVRGVDDDSAVGRMIEHSRTTGRAAVTIWAEQAGGRLLGRFEVSTAGSRRYTGGRTIATRPGDLRVAITLPHRSAFESNEPSALRPEQAMNRGIRGVLNALRSVGMDPFYPGREVVLVGGRPVGWLGLGEETGEGAVFEAGVATWQLSGTSTDELRAALDVAHAGLSWASVAGLAVDALPPDPQVPLAWDVPSDATRRGTVSSMLGRLEAYVALTDDWRIGAVRLAGDVIAPVATVTAIEGALVGLAPLRTTIADEVRRVLAVPGRWVLGIDGPADVAAALMDAIA